MRALRMVRQMQRNIEMKWVGASTLSDVIPIAGAGQMAGIGPYLQQGTTSTTRLGDKITVKSLALRINIALGALEATGCSVRIIIGYDRKPNGALPAITDILEADDLQAAYNTVGPNRGRFQFLTDRTIDFDSAQARWSDKFFLKKDLQVIYNGNAGTVADLDKGSIFIASLADGNAAAITVHWGYMIKFTDD